ncbi:phage tail protein [Hymenobacter ruber]
MDPFVGEIRIMPYGGSSSNFTTNGWAPCSGQLLAIRQYTALFSLLGTTFGGNGTTTFGLPDLRGRAIVGMGQGPGLSSYPQGTQVGTETVTLDQTQMPAHTHTLGTATVAVGGSATAASPAGGYFGAVSGGDAFGSGSTGTMAANMVNGPTTVIGGSQPHDNHQPYLALGYFIALQGIFPPRQ